MGSIYKLDYPGVEEMLRHDDNDELRRWISNWGPYKIGMVLASTEWLTIEEIKFSSPRGRRLVRYKGTIGSDEGRADDDAEFRGRRAATADVLPARVASAATGSTATTVAQQFRF